MTSAARATLAVAITAVFFILSVGAPEPIRVVTVTSAQAPKATLAIVGGTLIDGHGGPPLDQAVVLTTGTRISAIGTRASLPVPAGTPIVDAGGMTIMPGLIDGHVHLEILGHLDYAYWWKTYGARYEEIMAISAKIAIESGVTSVIDMWAPPEPLAAVRKKIESGIIPGPRIFASVGAIVNSAAIAGTTLGRETYSWKAATPDEARAHAEKMIAQGADVINMMDGSTPEQIRAVVEVARSKRVKVTGVAASPADLIARVKAGQQALDHMGGLSVGRAVTLDPEAVKAMQETRASVVPTALAGVRQHRALRQLDFYVNNRPMTLLMPPAIWADIRRTLLHPERIPRYGQGVRQADAEENAARFRQIVEAGIPVRVGTDAGAMYTLRSEAMWEEMELFVEYGLPPQEVIAAATRRNADWLGLLNDLGTIAEGKLADIIVVDGNPLATMRDLRHVEVVIRDGKVLKGKAVVPQSGSVQ